MRIRQKKPPFTLPSLSRPKATGKTPLRRFYRKTRQYYSRLDLEHRFMPLIRLLLGTCGGYPGQIWPFGDIFRAKGTLRSQDRTGKISEVFFLPKYPNFHRVSRRNSLFPAHASILGACYGPCESPTTFQCQVVKNEIVAQTGGSLRLPPVSAL